MSFLDSLHSVLCAARPHRAWVAICVLVLIVLSSCSGDPAVQAPTATMPPPPPAPVDPYPAPVDPYPAPIDDDLTDEPPLTSPLPALVEDQTSRIDGRLLYVKDGQIWEWQGNQTRRLLGDGQATHPEWSPNGQQIVFVQRGDSYSDILLADANGIVRRRLTDNQSPYPPRSQERVYSSQWALYPTFATNSRSITYIGQFAPPAGVPASEYNLSLFSLPTTGGFATQIYGDPWAQLESPTYNRERNELAYTRIALDGDGQQQIYRFNPALAGGEPYPGVPIRSYDPAFAHSGNWLLYTHRDEDGTDIWAISTRGNEPQPQRLTTSGMARAAIFAPDDSQIAFLAIAPGAEQFDLWLMDVEPNEQNRLLVTEPVRLTRNLGIDPTAGLSWAQ